MKALRFVLLAMTVALWTAQAQAQTLMANTTLSAAITATQTSFAVASATGWTVGNLAFADAEMMRITGISGTTMTVIRGVSGTASAAHASAEVIFTGGPNFFHLTDPDFGALCVRGSNQAAFLPWINSATGTIWKCQGNSGSQIWNGTRTPVITYNSIQTGSI